MKIRIKETNEIIELELNSLEDIMNNASEQFDWKDLDDESDTRDYKVTLSQDDFEWWENFVHYQIIQENMIDTLKRDTAIDIEQFFEDVDIGDQAPLFISRIKELELFMNPYNGTVQTMDEWKSDYETLIAEGEMYSRSFEEWAELTEVTLNEEGEWVDVK